MACLDYAIWSLLGGVAYLNEALHAEVRNSRCQSLLKILLNYCLILLKDFCVGQLVLLSVLKRTQVCAVKQAQTRELWKLVLPQSHGSASGRTCSAPFQTLGPARHLYSRRGGHSGFSSARLDCECEWAQQRQVDLEARRQSCQNYMLLCQESHRLEHTSPPAGKS